MEKELLNMSVIAGNVRQLRKVSKMTQKDLAKQLSVTIKSVYTWESGKSCPNLTNVLVLCNFFDVKIDDLIGNHVMKIN